MTKIDLLQLAIEIRSMTRRQKLYQVLKRELKRLHHWKDNPRGAPSKGYATRSPDRTDS
jgi:hypothetical protein